MSADTPTPKSAAASQTAKLIEPGLYWRGGTIFARLTMGGKRTWRSCETDKLAKARKLLVKWRGDEVLRAHGIEPKQAALDRKRLTVGQVIEDYVEAGCPTKKMKPKMPGTITDEVRFLNPIRQFFGTRAAATIELADCDKYRDWRNAGGYKSTFTVRGHEVTKKTRGGNRAVDAELQILSNALALAVRRAKLTRNPLLGRTRYTCAEEIRHCREVAPTPEGLQRILAQLRGNGEQDVADLVAFLACSGLRIGEALPLTWAAVNFGEGLINVKREKRGVNPWVAILPEMEALLHQMKARAKVALLFPSPFNPAATRDASAIRRRLNAALAAINERAAKENKPKLGHVTPHGLRSYFVTQARQSGLPDAEIAMLIGDKTGPAIIAQTYGDLRDDHLLAQARRIRLQITSGEVIPQVIPPSPQIAGDCTDLTETAETTQTTVRQVAA